MRALIKSPHRLKVFDRKRSETRKRMARMLDIARDPIHTH